jgi:hypothetical protein
VLDSMAPEVGLEPTTLRLTAECSAIELLRSVLWRLPDDRAFIVITKAARVVKGFPVESSIRSLFSRSFVRLATRADAYKLLYAVGVHLGEKGIWRIP